MSLMDFMPENRWNPGAIAGEAMNQAALLERDEIQQDHAHAAGAILGKAKAQSAKNAGAGGNGGMSPSTIGAIGTAGASLLGGIKFGGGGSGTYDNPFSGTQDPGTAGYIDFGMGGGPNYATSTGRLMGPTDPWSW